MLFGKLIQNIFDKKWVEGFENLVNTLGIQIFYETTWKWITYFELNVICELFMFYPYAVICDYLARYYSLCDIGILAPTFVMVIKFCLCDGDEFHLCDGRLVPSLWQHCHVALSLELYCYCSQNIVCSFMQAFWEVLCQIGRASCRERVLMSV